MLLLQNLLLVTDNGNLDIEYIKKIGSTDLGFQISVSVWYRVIDWSF